MALDIDDVYRDNIVKGDIHSGTHEPDKPEIRALLKGLSGAAANPSVIKQTKSALDLVTPASENYGGLVLNDPDPTKNGYYYRSAAAWVKGRGFPDTVAELVDLEGTANAVTAGVEAGVNPADIKVWFIEPLLTNSDDVVLNGLPVRNVNGDELAPGEWPAGRLILLVNRMTEWRLLSDPDADAAAAVATSKAAEALASAAVAEAAAAAASVAATGPILLQNIYSAKALVRQLPVINGFSEGFGLVGGLDTGASSGYAYDIGSKRIVNGVSAPTYGADITTGAQAISGGDDSFGAGALAKDKAFNNVTTNGTGWFSSQTGADVGGVAYIGQDFGTAKVIRRVTVLQNGAAVNSIGKVFLQYSSNGSTWTTLTALEGLLYQVTPQVFDVPAVSGGARYWRLLAAGQPSSGGWGVTEIEMMEVTAEGTPTNMILTSNGYDTLDFAPTTIQVAAILEAMDAATLNTDATMEVSRDDGVTWAAAALTQISTLGTTVFVASAPISVAGQPSGVLPAYRFKTFNNKRIYLHGLTLVGA